MEKLYCYISGLYNFGIKNNSDIYRKDFSVTDLCKHVGISRQQFYKLVNNESIPLLDTAYKIVDYLKKHTKYNYDILDLWSFDDLPVLKVASSASVSTDTTLGDTPKARKRSTGNK